MNAHGTSTARRATALAVAAALTLGTEGHALAAMAPSAGAKGQVSASTPAAPSPSDLSAQAIERFKAKDYEGAARLFEEAYKADPNPNYLFNIGRVYEEKGDIRAAVDYYQRFVKEPGVELESRELALQRLRVLKAILQETDAQNRPQPEDAPKDEPKPVAEGPKDEPKPVQTPPAEDPAYKKMWTAGFVLVGVGGVGMAVGGILGGVTLSKQKQLDGIHDYDTRVELAKQGRGLALGTDVLLSVGGVLVLTGVILVGVSASKRRTKAVADRRLWPTGLGLAGRF